MTTDRAAALLALRSHNPLGADDLARLHEARHDPDDPRVRTAALTVFAANADPETVLSVLRDSSTDAEASVRRRVAELAMQCCEPALEETLLTLLTDADASVADAAAAALGELEVAGEARTRIVTALADTGREHPDALVREAAIAALGSIGDERGLATILHGCTDKPAIRRRAVLALAPFSGPEVEAAIDRALNDRDWQTRQAAELLRQPG